MRAEPYERDQRPSKRGPQSTLARWPHEDTGEQQEKGPPPDPHTAGWPRGRVSQPPQLWEIIVCCLPATSVRLPNWAKTARAPASLICESCRCVFEEPALGA